MSYQRELTWRDAIQRVLREAGEPMHYADVGDEIAKQQLRTNLGATPASTVTAVVTSEIREHRSFLPASPSCKPSVYS